MEEEDVAEPKSPISANPHLNPRPAASLKIPAPFTPPPIMKISKSVSSFFLFFINLKVCVKAQTNHQQASLWSDRQEKLTQPTKAMGVLSLHAL